MTHKPAIARKAQDAERRSAQDRRVADSPPPGKHERRRSLEPRKPEVVELDMSNSEWATLNRDPVAPTK